MATLTAEQKAELAALPPEKLVEKLAAMHEITDRHDAKAQAAEAARLKLEQDISAKEEAARLATMTEIEKAKAQAAKAEQEAATARSEAKRTATQGALKIAAMKYGAVDVSDVLAVAGGKAAEVDGAADPDVAADALIAALKASKPHLFGAGKGYADNAAAAGGAASVRGATITKEALANMPPGPKRAAIFADIQAGKLTPVD